MHVLITDFSFVHMAFGLAAEFNYCHFSIAVFAHVYNTTVTIDDDGQLSKCGKETANTVKFLDLGGCTNNKLGFITICLPSTSHQAGGWAILCDDGDDQIGPMYAACRQHGFFGKPINLHHKYVKLLKISTNY